MLTLALLIALAVGSFATPFDPCLKTYTKNANSPSAMCGAFSNYARCVSLVAQSNTPTADDLVNLQTTFAANMACDVSSLDTFSPTIAALGGSIVFNVGSNEDLTLAGFDRTNVRTSSISSRLAALVGNDTRIVTAINAKQAAVAAAASTGLASAAISTSASASVTGVLASIATQSSTALAGQALVDSSLLAINNVAVSAQASIQNEENALAGWTAEVISAANAHRLALQVGLADDASDIVSIMGEDAGLQSNFNSGISNTLAAFSASQDNIAAQKALYVAAELSTFSANMDADTSTSVAAQVSRITARQSSVVATLNPKLGVQTGGNDYANCSSAADGAMYFSSNAVKAFICSYTQGRLWTPIVNPSLSFTRAGSRILTTAALDFELISKEGFLGTWIKCYDAVAQGWSSSTFHSNCDRKGATMTIALSTNNRIFGGFIEQSWWGNGRNNVLAAGQTFLYRYNTQNRVEIAFYPSQWHSAAAYDHISYCPTFGWTSDWLNMGTCQNPTFSPNYFTVSGYSNSWMAGQNSATLSRLEVYYRNTV